MNPATLVGDRLDDQFIRWMGDNTETVARFVQLAKEYRNRGLSVSAKFLIEKLRYDADPPLRDFNNNLTSRLARFVESMDPGLRGYFRTRELSAHRRRR